MYVCVMGRGTLWTVTFVYVWSHDDDKDDDCGEGGGHSPLPPIKESGGEGHSLSLKKVL